MIEDVVDGHGAEEVVLLVDHRTADQIVGSEVAGQRPQRGVGRQAGQVGVHDAADQVGGRFAQQRLQVHAAQIAAGGGGGRRAHHEHQ
jgi:hypothetical protein